jgi:hypothetical protein
MKVDEILDLHRIYISKVLVCEYENTCEKTSSKLLYASSMQNKTRENLQHIHSVLCKKISSTAFLKFQGNKR